MARIVLCTKCGACVDPILPKDPPAHMDSSNYIPSSQEVTETRGAMKKEEIAVEQYDKEISRLLEIVSSLRAGRFIVQQRINRRRSLLSSLRKLPPEILDHIFTFIHNTSEYSLDISKSNEASNPSTILPLSQVSSCWRQATLSRPGLWTSILIHTECIRAGHQNIIDAHLRNAGTHPLKISVQNTTEISSNDGRYPSTSAEDAVRAVIQELHRCAELKLLKVDGSRLDYALRDFQLPRLSFHHLRSFSYVESPSWAARTGSSTLRWIWKAVRKASNLVEFDTNIFRELNRIPYHQLTSIHLEALKLHQILRIVQATPNLEALKMVPHQSADPDLGAMLPVLCRSLRSMSIDTSACFQQHGSGSVFSRFFSLLQMPALERLEVKVPNDMMIWDEKNKGPLPRSFFSMIQRSSSTLEEVVWSSLLSRLPRTFYTDIVRSLPNLRSFRASNTSDRWYKVESARHAKHALHLLRALTVSSTASQPIIGPKLRLLHLTECESRITPNDAIEFLGMVESRDAFGEENSGVARLVDAKLEFAVCENRVDGSESESDAGPSANALVCGNDYSIVERIDRLDKKGVCCTVLGCEGWPLQ
ncbi:hypothetical protein VNI00_012477 [Paramarasmius palmivorus]|uniref:F-box domain-containing protein n=1 Tax=Paramarasmius palmivorus TaxID=297713 RepID=A0AAW0C484_9AGAR